MDILPQLNLLIARPRTKSEFCGHKSPNIGESEGPKRSLLDGSYDLVFHSQSSTGKQELQEVIKTCETNIYEFFEQ